MMGFFEKKKRLCVWPLEKRLMLDASLPTISGQVLWLDSKDGTTVLDADGDNAATGTGGAGNGFGGTVGTWQDKSGLNNHVTQGTAANRPTYNVTTLNGNPVLGFDGINDALFRLDTSASLDLTGNGLTILAVTRASNVAGAPMILNKENSYELATQGSKIQGAVETGSPGVWQWGGTTAIDTAWHMVEFQHANTLWNFFKDGTLTESIAPAGAQTGNITQSGGNFSIGARGGPPVPTGQFFGGSMAEVLLYNRTLTSDEMQDVENYLANKWGFAITNTASSVTTNTGKTLNEGATATIQNTNLAATDVDNTDTILRYTLTDAVDYGTLTNTSTGLALGLGDSFRQSDLDNGYITYTHNGTENFADSFSFTVSDGLAVTAATTFNLTITPVNETPVINGATLVSSEDFQAGAAGWSDNTTENGGAIYTTFLGRHSLDGGTQNVFKTYALSGTQNYVTISFDFYEIDSWDGENFKIFVDDAVVYNASISQATFNAPVDGASGAVSWTVQETTPFNGNFAYGAWNDQRTHFNLTVATTAASVKLGFSSTLDQATSDEAWGVDNIIVNEVGGSGTPGPFIVSEKSANGDAFGKVTATDPDTADTLTYTITGGTGAAIFAIHPTTGILTVSNAAALDYETTTSYTLTVLVTDSGGLTDTETVTVNVIDSVENTAPVINPLGPLSIAENTALNTVFGTAVATDVDLNTITYSITAGNTDNLFSINSANGQIRLSSVTNLNYEWDNSYTLTIRATDNGFGSLFSSTSVTINITDVNESPVFTPAQSVLATNPAVRYSAATGNFYQLVTTTANLATATANAAGMMLNGVAGYVATSTSAAENAYLVSLITTSVWLGGSDLAVEGEWRWSGGPEAGQMYWLGAAAGSAQGGFYTNWGGGEPNNSGGVEDGIQLLTGGTWNDINVASSLPYIVEWTGASVIAGLQNGPYSLAENSAGGSSVGFAHAGDPDAGDVLTYSITGGTGAAHFAVNGSTGEITLTNPAAANYELATSYTLNLRVQDVAGLFDTVTVTVNITDVNETPVLNTNTGTTLNEGASKVITSAMLSSSDVDTPPDSALIYTITNVVDYGVLTNTNTGLPIGLGGTFTQGDIDSGYIVYTHDDTENFSDAFSFTVSDGSITLPAATFNLTITPVNEVPVFTATGPYTIVENVSAGHSVGFSVASDPDTGDSISYSITGGTGAAHFAVNGSTGEITLTNPAAANYELATSYTLNLRVQDVAGLFDTAVVTINITDANDIPTALDLSGTYIMENSDVGSLVALLSTTDEDVADVHTYSLISNPGGKFIIVGNELRVAGDIDYERNQTIPLVIRTDDGHGGFYDRAVVIQIGDEADSFVPPPEGVPPSGDSASPVSEADSLPEWQESLIRASLVGGEEGQLSAFYGEGAFAQILREGTTFELRRSTETEGEESDPLLFFDGK
jgi:GTP cyclohydrolase III